nr:MAG TPA: hypothetical protein [Caudoviricetes sp.]
MQIKASHRLKNQPKDKLKNLTRFSFYFLLCQAQLDY